nr:MAG TPA: hypothetical protein [Inoviridae sp.]
MGTTYSQTAFNPALSLRLRCFLYVTKKRRSDYM